MAANSSVQPLRHRYSVGAEFFVIAENEDDARSIVGNFTDGFPAEVESWREGDVLMQDVSVVEENVEVSDV